MRACGCSKFAVQAMYEDPDPVKTIRPNPQSKPLIFLARDMHNQQLFPGYHLSLLHEKFIKYFDKALRLESLAQYSHASHSLQGEIIVSLGDLTSDIMINAGQDAYFGASLDKIDTRLAETFRVFDDLTWQIFYQYPELLSQKMHKAKRRIITVMEQYYNSPAEDRLDASWFARSMEAELRNVGFDTHDLAVMMMTIYWS